jgi:hypothetical protein
MVNAIMASPAASNQFGDVLLKDSQHSRRHLHNGLLVVAAGSFISPDKWLELAAELRGRYAGEVTWRDS